MANYYNTDANPVIPIVHHKVGERVVVLLDGAQMEAPKIVIRDMDTGRYFNKNTKLFEDFIVASNNSGFYTFVMNELYDMGIYNAAISTLPKERQQLLFEYRVLTFSDDGGSASTSAVDEDSAEVVGTPFYSPRSGNYEVEFALQPGSTDAVFAELLLNGTDVAYTSVSVTPSDVTPSVTPAGSAQTYMFSLDGLAASDEISIKTWAVPFDQGSSTYDNATVSNIKVYSNVYERHVFGGEESASDSSTCVIYGTLLDVSGNPLSGQKVEVYLNRAGYYTHKAGLVGYAATALTDESGYWEIPVIIGLDITINIPIIGFSQSGFVPALSTVELTPETLLKFKN